MRGYVFVLIFTIFFITVAAVPSTAALPLTLEGSLKVVSSPSGATVIIDGVNAGVTPLTIPNLALGYHSVELKKTGYQDLSTRGYVSFRQTTSVSATLVPVDSLVVPTTSPSPTTTRTVAVPTPTPTTGPVIIPTPTATSPPPAISQSLRVISDPADAVVRLDHVVVGKTPLSITDISPGTHTITIDKEGYRKYEKQITVQPGWVPLLVAVLVPESTGPTPTGTPTTPPPPTTAVPTGSLQVWSNPSGARVTVDGGTVGWTPASIPGIPAGTHMIGFYKQIGLYFNGSYETEVTVQAGSITKVFVTITPGPTRIRY